MSEVKWIKICTDIFNDEKIKLIDSLPERDGIFVIWIKLLTLAGRVNAGGYLYLNEDVPYTDEMLATIFNRPVNVVRLALRVFSEFKMIEIDNSTIGIINWEKHQNIDGLDKIRQDTKNRVAKFRERKKLPLSNVTETQSNAPDQNRTEEKRIKDQGLASLTRNETIKKTVAENGNHSVGSEANKLAVEELVTKVVGDKTIKNPIGAAIYRARNK